ncbi:coatomer subunit beta-like protein, putative [Medicago truncatula]|uniref:Coatomer subunit beta-like protein, putative n=1 Tax=Medicago truncatula TaxID=3880 RepID=G7K158_MEDTR|nr:coatomer subunit beta-like protein, putative [Medicago truncatula]
MKQTFEHGRKLNVRFRSQSGDARYRRAWQQICDVSRAEFDKIYQCIGVQLEEMNVNEQDYGHEVADIIRLSLLAITLVFLSVLVEHGIKVAVWQNIMKMIADKQRHKTKEVKEKACISPVQLDDLKEKGGNCVG